MFTKSGFGSGLRLSGSDPSDKNRIRTKTPDKIIE